MEKREKFAQKHNPALLHFLQGSLCFFPSCRYTSSQFHFQAAKLFGADTWSL